MSQKPRMEKQKGQCVLRFVGWAVLWVLVMPQRSPAQVLYGAIVGNVNDPSGAAVPRAIVTITNKGTNQSREANTDQSGSFNFLDVQSGTYSMKASKVGFKTFEKTEVPVALNNVTRVNVTLEVGAVTQTLTVTAEAPLLQTETPEVHAEVTATEFENLPVPLGRNYQQVFRALPGLTPPQNSHSIPTNPARSLAFNVNGTSNNQNNTRIDGVSTYNIQLPHVTSYVPNLESIQEVNVVTNTFDAEQGLAGGAAINVQTKSGTNQLHGSLFEFNSNNHIKAWPDRFDNAGANVGTKPKLIYNQFGGTIGGPIKKDKLFYFASYEGTYDYRSVERRVSVPTPAMKKGDFSASKTALFDPTTGNPDGTGRTQFSVSPSPPDPNFVLCNTSTNPQCLNIIPAAKLDPIALKIAALLPDPNLSGLSNNYFASGPFSFNRHQVDSKINWNATSKLDFIGTFGILHYNDITPTVFGDKAVGRPIGGTSNPGHGFGNTYRFTIMGTYTFAPNFIMDAHFGWARQGTSSEQPGLGTNIGRDVLGIPGTNGTRRFESGWPEFQISNFATLGISNNFMPYYRQDPQYQYVANFNWVRKTHNVRFGTDLYRMGLNQSQAEFISDAYGAQGGFRFVRGLTSACLTARANGTCAKVSKNSNFNSFGAFMIGQAGGSPFGASRTLQVPDVYHIRAWLVSAYARDRWNITPKLTAQYGLRWEYFPVPTRPDRGIERYDPSTNNVLVCGIGSVPKGCGIEVSKKLFAPRIGLAYRATDTFVIRAGYGITNDPFESMELLRANYPILIALNLSNPKGDLFPVTTLQKGIPAIVPPDLGNGILPLPGDVGWQGLPKRFDRGYVQSWNVMLQKQLKWGFTGQAGYVATRQTRQLAYLDVNAGQVIGAGDAGRPLFAKYGRNATTTFTSPVGTGTYDSLQATLNRRFTQGLQLTVNYTWGHAIGLVDNSDSNPNIQALPYMRLNRGTQPFDRQHSLGITNIWQLPFGKGRRWASDRGLVSSVLSGWQVNSLVSVISGPPFTIGADDTSLNLPGSSQQADQVKPLVQKLGGIGVGTPYYDPTAFADVSDARFGTSGFNILRGPGLFNWDFGLFREFRLTERWRLQFRAESFNFTNTPHFRGPNSDDDTNCVCNGIPGPPDFGSFMTVISTINLAREGIDERQFRFGLRLNF